MWNRPLKKGIKKPRLKNLPRVSANRPSNNWALLSDDIEESSRYGVVFQLKRNKIIRMTNQEFKLGNYRGWRIKWIFISGFKRIQYVKGAKLLNKLHCHFSLQVLNWCIVYVTCFTKQNIIRMFYLLFYSQFAKSCIIQREEYRSLSFQGEVSSCHWKWSLDSQNFPGAILVYWW